MPKTKPKNIKKLCKSNCKNATEMLAETKRSSHTSEQRKKVRTDLHELLVMKPMLESQYDCTSGDLMEQFIEEAEKILFDKFDSGVQYMVAYRRVYKCLQESTFRQKISERTMNANKLIQLALDHKSSHKSKENESKLRRNKPRKKPTKKNLEESKPFSIFDLLECQPTAGSACDANVIETSSIQEEIVDET